jgi:maltooligosyltrehalose trehalohydrolase
MSTDLNDVKYINPFEIGGYGLDMQWADDFHHALHALFTGEKNGYYSDFGTLEGLMKAIQSPFVYNGVYSNFRKRTYGNSSRKNPSQQFIVFSQNHDQVGNRMKGERLSQLISFELAKVAAGIVLTSPYTPMLFMGEEYFEQNPFQYFVSHNDPELNRLVEKGRKREFESFYKNASEDVPAPADIQTFKRSLLSWSVEQDELSKNMFNVYKALILLRKNYPTIHATPRSEIELHKTLNGFISDYQFNENQTLMVFNLSEEDGDVTITMKTKGVLKKIFDSADQKWAGPGTSLPHTIQTADIINIRAESFAIFSNI